LPLQGTGLDRRSDFSSLSRRVASAAPVSFDRWADHLRNNSRVIRRFRFLLAIQMNHLGLFGGPKGGD